MADIVISVASKIIEYSVEPAIQQGKYLFCVRKIKKNLENEMNKLISTKENVQNGVEEAKKKTEKIENVVEKWLNEVTDLLVEVENLLREINEHSNFGQGWKPTWTWRRYHLCRQMAKKTRMMMELNNSSKFEKFSRLATLPINSSRNFMYFKSTESAYNQLLEAIQDDDSYMIGLYGMGGCGKTTLAKEVGKKTKDQMNLFDKVAFTTVSQTPNIRRIQGEIADFMGLRLEEETEVGRAGRISLRLRSGERILVILDDVWARLNLEDIGIPFNEDHGSCKVLLTTRRQQVCTLMECQRKIPLDILSDDEAWDLLHKHARIDDDSSSSLLNELAWGVVRECKGLPLAIEVVGRSLSGKSIDEWKIAVDRLKHSKPIDVDEGERDVFACLRLSYDYLGSRLAKSLLLMCSLFPEDYEILIEDLFRYGMGLSFCGEFESFDIARSQVNASIKMLIDSSLLIHRTPRKHRMLLDEVVSGYVGSYQRMFLDLLVPGQMERIDRVKMHDVVRDVALWIASQEGHAMMVDPVIRDLRAKATNCFAVSFWNNEILQLSDLIDAPKLEILLLNAYNDCESSLKLSNGIFEGKEELKVMTICNNNFFKPVQSLPISTHLLTNLRILRLVRCQLDDISFVVRLGRLEILDLSGSHLKELPNGIENLSRLKLLDLSFCQIDMDCYQVIARCSQLEELYAFGSNIYSRSINSYECFLDDAAFPKLHRYSLEIGGSKGWLEEDWIDLDYVNNSRLLQICDFNPSTSGGLIKDFLQRSERASLVNLTGGSNNIIPEMAQAIGGGLNEVGRLNLENCSEVICFIDSTSDQADSIREDPLPRLVCLTLSDMENMKEVCRGPPPYGFFEKLKIFSLWGCHVLRSIFPRECQLSNLKKLLIEYCPMLISVFPISVAQSLILLEKLTIVQCNKMKQIITNGEINIDEWGGLSLLPRNSSFMFPKLRTLIVRSCAKLECIFPISCVEGLLQLECLLIERCPELKYVCGEREHDVHSSDQNDMHIKLPRLQVLHLLRLPNLLSIFPNNYDVNLPCSLKVFHFGCPKLTLPDDVSAI